ncbi:MAG TPA: SUMF1/EgtB/PvdO family nonheme iron enzyme [Sedimentisphaerales bacterium]|nr:SUMF1/EgtB/PvdO family nonheme iron enzyme [Sedimentisphaerales bacterium]
MTPSRARAGILAGLATLAVLAGCKRQEGEPSSQAPMSIITKTGVEMVLIPAGTFTMGDDEGGPDERPAHKVKLDAFFIDRYEVVQAEFKKHKISDPSHFKGDDRPLEQINWTDATLYCNERSLAEGFEPCYDEETWECNFDASGYRLPTEAEWEYACRAGTDTKYSFGDRTAKLGVYAWWSDTSGGTTHPVGRKQPNPWGLYDMHGNVAEWCNDRYDPNYYAQSPSENPRGPAQGQERVIRGGAWNSNATSCKSAYRAGDPAIDDTCLANDAIGFRCVRRAPTESPAGKGGAIMPSDPRPKTAFVYHNLYLEHKTTPGHPESPGRLTAIVEHLKAVRLDGKLAALTPEPAPRKWIQTVHTAGYIERARKACAEGDDYLDTGDVPISTRSYEAAVMAAGGVLTAVDAVMKGQVRNAFCAVRPPGHHALADRAMGFCIFNNVAIGARYVQQQYGLARVLIVDWDVHHGNGTQATFYDDPSVLYFSVHQYPFYPGTGTESETGKGPGVGTTINVPLPAGSDDDDFLEAFEKKLTPAADSFGPDFVFVSAGFDAHENDTLGGMRVTTACFGKLTRIVKGIAERSCQGRLVSVLEGGYGLGGLASSVETHLRVLMD